jgi:DNA-binding PadR family transcriptional regulator
MDFLKEIGISRNGIQWGGEIVLYLSQYTRLPEDNREIREPQRWTVKGICERTGIPEASCYRAMRWLCRTGITEPHAGYIYPLGERPHAIYQLTKKGREYAAALRIFQQSVEAIR